MIRRYFQSVLNRTSNHTSRRTYEHSLFGMGNPMIDITALVPTSFLEKYRLKKGESTIFDQRHEGLYADLVQNYPLTYTAGGATLNVIRGYQWMIQEGEDCGAYVGSVGKDNFGNMCAEKLGRENVHGVFDYHEKLPTGNCVCLITEDSERTLIANLGAADQYSYEHFLASEVQTLVEEAKIFYYSGFFLSCGADVILETAKHSYANDKIFAINLSAEFVIKELWDKMEPVLEFTDYLFSNDKEAVYLAEQMQWEDLVESKDILAIAERMANWLPYDSEKPKRVVFTCGIRPLKVALQIGEGQSITMEFEIDRLPSEKVIDTNGAGDSFVGGFLSQLAKGRGIEDCVEAAKFSSTRIVQTRGVIFPIEPPDFPR